MDPLSYFSFHPVLHDWCNKGHGMCYLVCMMMHIKEPLLLIGKEGRNEMFYLTTHSTHFIYGYMASDISLRTILIVRKKTRCRHICYSFRLTAKDLLYASSYIQDSTYHGLCYTSRRALAETRNISIGSPHELIGKSNPCGGSGFPHSLSEWSFTICMTLCNRKMFLMC